MRTWLLFVLLLHCVTEVHSMIEHIPLPDRLQECFARYAHRTSIVETVGESISASCVGQYTWTAAREHVIPGFNISREAYNWVQGLASRTELQSRHRRQAMGLRVRKEYRRLTDQERINFHRAVNMLKADTSVAPNMYDALSAIHQGIMTTAAHGGPNFLGFHRVYLLMFENALRQKIPSVTVPYWDSTLDEAMFNPAQSILFSQHFMGNGFGVVRTGPFAGWTTLSGPLIRNTGQTGQLFSSRDIARILSNIRVAQITEPNAPLNSSLEFLHNQVHLWIDGQMGSLETASHDPIFWMHHAYVDYVWELFRQRQRQFGIDPTLDYPSFVNNSMHTAAHPMGLAGFRNIEGMSDVFTSAMYTYEAAPRCSQQFPDCGTPYLQCLMVGFQPTCVSRDWSAAAFIQPMQQSVFGIAANIAAQTQRFAMLQQRRQQQQQIMMRMRRIQLPPSSPMFENEAAALDDASERMSRRRRREEFMRLDRVALVRRLIRVRKAICVYPKSAFDVKHVTMNPHVQDTRWPLPYEDYVRIKKSMAFYNMVEAPPMVQNTNDTVPPIPQLAPETCSSVPMTQGYQNTFNINGRSNIHQWVYIPVKVIYQRPPTFDSYPSYPIVDEEVEAEDIYSPNSFANMRSVLQSGNPASYSKCNAQESGAGRVYVVSKGLNYMGTYKEYTVVDHRLAISIATGYVAVKSPQFGASDVFLSAYDSCGRVCIPYCKLEGQSGFQRCFGAFRVTSSSPHLYGTNYGDAVTNLWRFGKDNCPVLQDDNVYIQFHCSFRESWPFTMTGKGALGGALTPARASSGEFEEPEPPEVEGASTKTCHVGGGCMVTSSCTSCAPGQTVPCLGTCQAFASCQQGKLVANVCPNATWFNPNTGMCENGQCSAKQGHALPAGGTRWF
ncbi:hypothetical protein DPMN_170349 [Dreissena polymorpha]|uniref:Tyrosinase copper-binding domain-containing protein n=1 Tax=Dreissena polymorpha TaxID=45954 RepID=A0A9D4IE68_DREPO|nr:hypothetical protein DPMN_170349 [Dreissena polymorpha]